MSDDLISKIKKAFGKKEEEHHADSDSTKTFLFDHDQTKTRINETRTNITRTGLLQGNEDETQVIDNSNNSSNRQKIVRVIIVIGVIVGFGLEFFTPSETPKQSNKTTQKIKNKPKRKLKKKKVSTPQEVNKTENSKMEKPEDLAKNSVDQSEDIKKVEVPEQEVVEQSFDDLVKEGEKESENTDNLDIVGEDNFNGQNKENENTFIVEENNDDNTSELLNKIKENIVEEIPNPDFLSLGRGLVYNCKLGFWACVDKANYFKCEDSLKIVKKNNKNIQCYPLDVYKDIEDCKKVLTYNVNRVEDSSFCDNSN